ncbi:pimeloyl-ACP methyl ester carboxylesterase [Saccharopolyspora gloriosae]|uniref:Pimeloyl-ACP methyl ester carboxylesterase n=1 Tax=Saccharopolyspora gloriosae TaxID=455344 RepID=A0A840N671_9PSEU|nr:alpha/beta hydrolase [Saccharopolyspora gloriosae]MBB5067480.1 pimeloyl-ACP methyl ester carboxylesterase [Saccharopolyspora gloriosae]
MRTRTRRLDASRSSGELTRVPMPADAVETHLSGVPAPGRQVPLITGFGPATVHVRDTPGSEDGIAVYLHGLAGSATNWTDLAASLAPHLRGIAVDLPGFGLSEPPDWFDYSCEQHAHVVIRLLEESLTGAVHLFGNSFGGAVAVLIAARRPDLVSSLTLISPAMPDLRPDPRRLSDPRIPLAWLPLLGPAVRRRLAAVPPGERARKLLELCFADPAAVPDDRLRLVVEEFRERADFAWAEAALGRTTTGLMWSWLSPPWRSPWNLLPEVAAPGLVVWGAQDRVVSVRKAPRTARELRRGRLLVLPRTGHVAQLEHPRVVAAAVIGMLREVEVDRW